MNKKVSDQFKGIKDTYLLQCICTEQNDEIERLYSIFTELRDYNFHLLRDSKYHLNAGHLKKINKILRKVVK